MKFSKNTGKKKGAAAAVLCFVAAIAIAGTYTFNDYKESKKEKELAKAEETNITEENYSLEESEKVLDEAVDGEIVSNESDTADETTDSTESTSESTSESTRETISEDIA